MKNIFFLILFFSYVCVYTQTYELADEYWYKAKEAEKKNDWESAAKFFEQSIKSERLSDNPRKKDILKALNESAFNYYKIRNYKKAILLFKEAIDLSKTVEGKNHKNYTTRLTNLAAIYRINGQLERALPLYTEALNLIEKTKGKNNNDYSITLNSLARVYQLQALYDKALPLFIESQKITGDLLGKNHQEYGISLNNLASLYSDLGLFDKALPLYLDALKITENTLGKEHSNYLNQLNNLAVAYKSLRQYDKALPIYSEIIKNTEKILGKDHPDYARYLNNFGAIYANLGLNNAAIELYEEALINREKNLGLEHPLYAVTLNNLAGVYKDVEQYDKSIEYYQEALMIKEKSLGKDHPDYGMGLNNLALVYKKKSANDKAIQLYEEALTIIKNTFGKSHEDYVKVLSNLADLYMNIQEFEKALQLYIEENSINWFMHESVFTFLTEYEKRLYLVDKHFSFYTYLSFEKLSDFQFSELTEMNLNNQYLLKGLLINDYTNMLRDLSELNDKEIDALISGYRSSHELLAKQITTPISNRIYNVDSLQKSVQQEESELVKVHNQLFESRSLVLDWRSVQKNLKPDEVVVEFSKFQFRNKDGWTKDHLYVAYVFDKQSSSPTPIYLFEENELNQVVAKTSPSSLYNVRGSKATSVKASTSEALYNLIWKPLKNHFADKQTIYFSPSGKLNQLALVALPDENGKLMLSKYNMHQMSNTANLAQLKTKVEHTPVIFVGGIQYDFNPDKKTLNQKEKLSLNLLDTSKRSNQNGTWQYLPGTELEANKLNELYNEENLNATIVIGEDATEEWFKSLSGNSPNVLHIATHGFFFEDIKDTLSSRNEQPKYTLAKDPLLRSGLVLAHGNYTWQHGTNPYQEEDGILTAYEISKLDFQNTDMVVLSACETGLGDIDGSEGVYGLQRAFKMAGVDIIVMSLWEVPDKETSEFMQLFYSNWLEGNPVREAFRNTQRTMSAKYQDTPEKWAAFVLFE